MYTYNYTFYLTMCGNSCHITACCMFHVSAIIWYAAYAMHFAGPTIQSFCFVLFVYSVVTTGTGS